MLPAIPVSWRTVLADELRKPYYQKLQEFLDEEWQTQQIFPSKELIFSALEETAFDEVRVLLLGQDPYHDDGQAHGMCFSVQPGVRPPPSLVNIYKELRTDVGCTIPNNGYLMPWARQGVLLLNTVLTVRAHQAASHKNQGWEKFTDAIIAAVNDRSDLVVFLLWGAPAQKKMKLIDANRHAIVTAPHPSPLSASKGFFGSQCFSKVNAALKSAGKPEIDWQIPNI
jgi:uracil-DNA glycosylase